MNPYLIFHLKSRFSVTQYNLFVLKLYNGNVTYIIYYQTIAAGLKGHYIKLILNNIIELGTNVLQLF